MWRLKRMIFLIYSWLITLIIFLVLFPNTIKQYDSKVTDYTTRIKSRKELNIKEKCSIFGLNIMMSTFAYPIYPEAAKESCLLHFKVTNDLRIIEDDFFMESEKIKSGFDNNQLMVTWSTSECKLGNLESRYALALNSCKLNINETNLFKEYSVETRVEYPKYSALVLISDPIIIKIEEGLFNYLQQEEWLHPYTVIWKTKIYK